MQDLNESLAGKLVLCLPFRSIIETNNNNKIWPKLHICVHMKFLWIER